MFSRLYLLLAATLTCGLLSQEAPSLLAQQSPPSSSSTASSSTSTSNCTASLLADTQAIAAGSPFKVAVRFQLAKGWHLYWRFPGDSGAPPSIQWHLPEGFEVGPIQWPMPQPLQSEGNITTYVYEDELVLTAFVKPPIALSGSSVALKAKLKWFICSDTCMPGKGEVSLEIPVGTPSPIHQEIFEKAAAALPLHPPPPFQVSWSRTPNALEISVLNLPENQTLEIYPLPPKGMTPGRLNLGARTASAQTASITLSEPDPEGASWAALFVLTGKEGSRQGWELSALDSPKINSGASQSPPIPSATTQSGTANQHPVKPSSNLFAVLWGAFLGGLLLNLMPCVLPVIALKIFGFTQQAGQDPRRVFRLGLAFTAGVFAFFLALAAAVIVLKAAGGGLNWGFQFQNPWILVGLIAAVFVFGMSLLGVFEITLANEANARMSELSGRHGYGGAFLHGLFTTLLGTSCTAPYLGVTLGFAVSQTGPTVLLIFLTIAAGMSLPYLLLTANPSLLRFLPKPGLWMERLKQGMGFVMLAVAVWLLSVLGQSRGVEALSGTAALLLVLGAGCWLVGILQSRFLSILIAAALAASGYLVFLHDTLVQPPAKATSATKALGEIWQPYTAEALASARAAGHPVFVDFTADWCLNCKVNERLTLSKTEVLEAFKKRNVVLLKADWTNGEKEITAELNRFGRVGVPFYLLYPASGGDPILFPELLTPTMVLEALQKLPQP